VSELARVHIEREGDRVVVAIEGEVDPSNARAIGRDMTDQIPNEAMAVVLDLCEVGFLDSSGIQMLFELAERLDARQQRLVVVAPPSAPARKVLDIVALDATAPLVDTRAAAAAHLCGNRS
jgi:anti-sigma B factor antagonist